jgi:Tfp pilus assembly protein PilF
MGYYLARDFEKARDELKAMLRLAPHDIDAHMYLASVYREMGDRKKALATFRRVALLDENSKWGWQLEREVKELGN